MKKNRMLSAFCFLAFFVLLMNEARAYRLAAGPEKAASNYEEITENGLSSRMMLEELFVRLGDIEYGNEGVLYISVAAFLILLLGAGRALHRRTFLWTGIATTLLLLTLTKVTPVHRLLAEHIFYFRFMRHSCFFHSYLLAAAVLLVAESLQGLLTQDIAGRTRSERFLKMAFVVTVHGGFILFLRHFGENIIFTTYLAVGLSAVYWGHRVFYPGLWRQGRWLFVLCLLIQPTEVFWHYHGKAIGYGHSARPEIVAGVRSVPSPLENIPGGPR